MPASQRVSAKADAAHVSEFGKETEDDLKQLAELGYKRELFRGFGTFSNAAFCFTSVSIIPSIAVAFSLSGVGLGGPPIYVWGWIVASIFCSISGLAMAEIASVFPNAGSVYHWAGMMAPESWAEASAYYCGWINLLGNSAGDVAFAQGFATFVDMAVVLAMGTDHEMSIGAQVGVAIGVLFLWTAMDWLRTDIQAVLNLLAVFWQMGCAISIVVVVLVFSPERASVENVYFKGVDTTGIWNSTDEAHPDGEQWLGMPVSGYACVMGITTSLFCFTGYESAAHMSEETTNSRISAPRGIMLTVFGCSLIGAAFINGILFATPNAWELDNVLIDTFTFAVGHDWGLLLTCLIIVCYFFAGMSSTTVTARIMYALSRDGGLPFSGAISKVYASNRSPWNASLAVCIFGSVMLVIQLGTTQSTAAFVGTCTVGYQLSYAWPILLRLVFVGSKWEKGAWNLGCFSTPVALIAVVWQISSSLVFFWPFSYPVVVTGEDANMNWTVVIFFGTLLLAWLNWMCYSRFHYNGPRRRHNAALAVVLDTAKPAGQVASATSTAAVQVKPAGQVASATSTAAVQVGLPAPSESPPPPVQTSKPEPYNGKPEGYNGKPPAPQNGIPASAPVVVPAVSVDLGKFNNPFLQEASDYIPLSDGVPNPSVPSFHMDASHLSDVSQLLYDNATYPRYERAVPPTQWLGPGSPGSPNSPFNDPRHVLYGSSSPPAEVPFRTYGHDYASPANLPRVPHRNPVQPYSIPPRFRVPEPSETLQGNPPPGVARAIHTSYSQRTSGWGQPAHMPARYGLPFSYV